MWRAAVLGVVAGLRSQLPTALLAWRQSRGDLPRGVAGPARILRRRGAVPLTALAAAGELVVDKLPMTPNRLDEGALLGRLTLGAAAGSGIAATFGRSRIVGGAVGAAGAAAGSVLGQRYRAILARSTDVPDVVWALTEDAAAIGLGLAATRGRRQAAAVG